MHQSDKGLATDTQPYRNGEHGEDTIIYQEDTSITFGPQSTVAHYDTIPDSLGNTDIDSMEMEMPGINAKGVISNV